MRRLRIPLVLIAAYVLLSLASFAFIQDWAGRQTFAVILTGAVVMWYTWETSELRRAAHRQIALQARPFVVLSRVDGEFKVTNIGNGPALNVRIADVQVLPDDQAVIKFPDPIAILPLHKATAVKAKSFFEGRFEKDFLDAHLDPTTANRALAIEITYQDVDLRTYRVTQSTGPGRFEVSGFKESAGI